MKRAEKHLLIAINGGHPGYCALIWTKFLMKMMANPI